MIFFLLALPLACSFRVMMQFDAFAKPFVQRALPCDPPRISIFLLFFLLQIILPKLKESWLPLTAARSSLVRRITFQALLLFPLPPPWHRLRRSGIGRSLRLCRRSPPRSRRRAQPLHRHLPWVPYRACASFLPSCRSLRLAACPHPPSRRPGPASESRSPRHRIRPPSV